jgi:PhnB protein
MPVDPIPDGYQTVTPYLIIKGIDEFVEFLIKLFSAQLTEQLHGPRGRTIHAEVRIGDSLIMIGEQPDGSDSKQGVLYVYTDDVDRLYQRALDYGCKSISAPQDQFYGDRSAGFEDPFGVQWWVATHIEDVSPEEMARRSAGR